jgi:hypothetical protein
LLEGARHVGAHPAQHARRIAGGAVEAVDREPGLGVDVQAKKQRSIARNSAPIE